MTGLERLKSGDFNDMSQERLPDGSILVTLSKRGAASPCKFRVRNLYQPGEEVVDLETGLPPTKGERRA